MSNNNPELNVSVTFRHTESTEALKSYADEKVSHMLAKYLVHNAEAHVVLSVEKRDHTAEVKVYSKGHDVSAKATTGDLYSAIDKVVDIIATLIKKQKEKMLTQKHHSASYEL